MLLLMLGYLTAIGGGGGGDADRGNRGVPGGSGGGAGGGGGGSATGKIAAVVLQVKDFLVVEDILEVKIIQEVAAEVLQLLQDNDGAAPSWWKRRRWCILSVSVVH